MPDLLIKVQYDRHSNFEVIIASLDVQLHVALHTYVRYSKSNLPPPFFAETAVHSIYRLFLGGRAYDCMECVVNLIITGSIGDGGALSTRTPSRGA